MVLTFEQKYKRMIAEIEKSPGIRQHELAKKLKLDDSKVFYRTRELAAMGRVRLVSEPGYVRIYPVAPTGEP